MNNLKKVAVMACMAIVLIPSSWQVYNSVEKKLTVHYGNTANSPVCFQGAVEDYDGNCTSPRVINPEYEAKQQAIRQGTWVK